MKVRVNNVMDNHARKAPMFEKQLKMGDQVELQLGPNLVVRIVPGREQSGTRKTLDIRVIDGGIEVEPIAANNILLKAKNWR